MTRFRALLDGALARLARVGAQPGDDEETRQRKAMLLLVAILVLPISLTWAALYLALGAWSGLIAVLYFVISVGTILLYAVTKTSRDSFAASCW